MNIAGDIAEAYFIHAAMSQGYEVFTPFGHRSKVDVVIRKPQSPLIGVQIKKGVYQKKKEEHHADSWKFLIGSCKSKNHHNPESGPRIRQYCDKDFDIMAVVIQEHGVVALYKLEDIVGNSSKRWNISDPSAPRNNWGLLDYFVEEKD